MLYLENDPGKLMLYPGMIQTSLMYDIQLMLYLENDPGKLMLYPVNAELSKRKNLTHSTLLTWHKLYLVSVDSINLAIPNIKRSEPTIEILYFYLCIKA